MRKNTTSRKPSPTRTTACELLAPAGNMEKLRIVVRYGADAVYLGGPDFSLRAHAGNFSLEEIREAADYCRLHDVRLYVTVNIFPHNRDLGRIKDYLAYIGECGVDGLIVSDPGVLRLAAQAAPGIPIHISTQANITNLESVLFWQKQGAGRVNLARELSLSEIEDITQNSRIETEVFVHGALCIAYSGRCLLSLYLTGRNSNQGDCAHPCRYSYSLQEEKRPAESFPVEEDGRGTYILNSKDLCLLDRLPELVRAGIAAIKIEGRMKGVYYAGGIVRIYRAALDYLNRGAVENPDVSLRLPDSFRNEVEKLGTRGYTENFFNRTPESEDMLYQGARISHTYRPVAVVTSSGTTPSVEARHPLEPGNRLEYMGDGLDNISFEIAALEDGKGRPLSRIMPGEKAFLKASPRITFREQSLIRKTP